MSNNGATLLVSALSAIGVRTIFNLSGKQIMPIFDACIDADIRLVHVRHEAAAVYMAEAWAQQLAALGQTLRARFARKAQLDARAPPVAEEGQL